MSGDASTTSLVVNADDFGLSPEVSRGILTAHREGIVTSTSVLGNIPDVKGAASLLSEAPKLGVGVQLTVVGGVPVCAAGSVPTLVGPAGTFPELARDVFLAWGRGRLKADELEREFDAQVTRAKEAGLRPDHLNTHHHIGVLPPVGIAVEAVAKRHGIPGVRTAVERPSLAWITELPRGVLATMLGGLSWLTRRQMGTLRHGPQSWGYVESGQLDEVRVLEIFGRLGPGSHELICHPGEVDDLPADEPGDAGADRGPHRVRSPAGFGHITYHRARELAALTAPVVRTALARRGLRLCRWADLF